MEAQATDNINVDQSERLTHYHQSHKAKQYLGNFSQFAPGNIARKR